MENNIADGDPDLATGLHFVGIRRRGLGVADHQRGEDLPGEGAASLKAAVIPVILYYSTADQLA